MEWEHGLYQMELVLFKHDISQGGLTRSAVGLGIKSELSKEVGIPMARRDYFGVVVSTQNARPKLIPDCL
jgi:hypothetical protein